MKYWRYILGFLSLVILALILAFFSLPDANFRLIACDVGQGDAILATYKNFQILTDGGPDEKVLDCLGEYMPFWDREIELVILTHPQLDHFGGLIEVFKRYKVNNLLANRVDAGSSAYQVLKNEVGGRGIPVINPKERMIIRYDLIQLEILHPTDTLIAGELLTDELMDRNKTLGVYTTKRDLNEYSIVHRLKFGSFDALFTGDIDTTISNQLAANSSMLSVEYIKIPHHGSKNGLSMSLINAAQPKIAVISSGKNNTYGHPHEEVLKILSEQGIKILRTDEKGTIEVVTDGKRWWLAD